MIRKYVGILVLVLSFALSGAVFAKDTKMAFVNMKRLFFDYKKTKDFNKELEKEDTAAKEEIEKKSDKIRKLRDEIDLLSDDAKEKRQPELEKALKGFNDYRQEKAESFIQKKDEMFQKIRSDIMYAASEYAKKNDYNMVLDGSVFVYSSENYDITDAILKELNKK